ncbi:hypothetical protein C9374_013246 [Naegleria lovaniensis]|uniref:Uncharacterized protein n=1 Tax=Naegleria lovaniensis TaxID=51637 RepID=A0AA88KPQ2_NAELO|nr:uncharacterized protein C9374_013246 [Naegleria lovaniensis]KAG2391761.1 hypothetical protein C9374_013246 [Naegleria lovaniensis]
MCQQETLYYAEKTTVICICGSTSSGKSTLAKALNKHYQVVSVCQDLYRSKMNDEHKMDPELKGNMECMESVDFNKFETEINNMLSKYRNNRLLFAEGYLSCCQQEVVTRCFDAIIFLDTTDREVAKKRRWNRTVTKHPNRGDDFNEFSQKFDSLIWKYYMKYRNLQMDNIVKSGKEFVVIGVDDLTSKEVFHRAVEFIDLFKKNDLESIRNSEKYCRPPSWYLDDNALMNDSR